MCGWRGQSRKLGGRRGEEGFVCLFVLFNRTQQGLLTGYSSLSPQRNVTSTFTAEVMVAQGGGGGTQALLGVAFLAL